MLRLSVGLSWAENGSKKVTVAVNVSILHTALGCLLDLILRRLGLHEGRVCTLDNDVSLLDSQSFYLV